MELGLLMKDDEQISLDGKELVFFQHKLLQEYVASLYIEDQMEQNPTFFMATLKSSRDLDRNEETIEFVSELVGKVDMAYEYFWLFRIICFVTIVMYFPEDRTDIDGSKHTLYQQWSNNIKVVLLQTFATFFVDIPAIRVWAATFAKIPLAKRLPSLASTLCFIVVFAVYNFFWNTTLMAYFWLFIKFLRIFLVQQRIAQFKRTISWGVPLFVLLFVRPNEDGEIDQNWVVKYFLNQCRSCTLFDFRSVVIKCLARL